MGTVNHLKARRVDELYALDTAAFRDVNEMISHRKRSMKAAMPANCGSHPTVMGHTVGAPMTVISGRTICRRARMASAPAAVNARRPMLVQSATGCARAAFQRLGRNARSPIRARSTVRRPAQTAGHCDLVKRRISRSVNQSFRKSQRAGFPHRPFCFSRAAR